MEQRYKIILQNYLKTTDYICNDYKIVNNHYRNNCFIIYYKNQMLFFIYSNNHYIKYNNCLIQKNYKHNKYLYYYNNKNNKISFSKTNINLFKLIYINNNTECKYYNTFFNMYKKIIKFYELDICFMYYYSIKKPYIIYIYKKYESKNIYEMLDLYSNHYSILYLII